MPGSSWRLWLTSCIQFCLEAERREMTGLPIELVLSEEEWAKEMWMGSFLSVSRRSIEPAKVLEM